MLVFQNAHPVYVMLSLIQENISEQLEGVCMCLDELWAHTVITKMRFSFNMEYILVFGKDLQTKCKDEF